MDNYFDDERRKTQAKIDEIKSKHNSLIAYLAHCNKPEHLKTAMGMIDSIARLESSTSWLAERQQDKQRNMNSVEQMPPEHRPRIIELPFGARKVSIEL